MRGRKKFSRHKMTGSGWLRRRADGGLVCDDDEGKFPNFQIHALMKEGSKESFRHKRQFKASVFFWEVKFSPWDIEMGSA